MRHDERVHAIIRGRLLSRYDKRRYILTETTAGLNHRPSPNPGSLAHQYIASEDHIIFQDAISGNLTTIAEYTTVSDLRIMRNMYPLMQEITITDTSTSFRCRGTVNHHILTNHVVISDYGDRITSLIKEILRLSSDNSPVKYTVAISHACTAHQAGMRHDLAIIPDLHVLINVRKRMNRNVLPDLCA